MGWVILDLHREDCPVLWAIDQGPKAACRPGEPTAEADCPPPGTLGSRAFPKFEVTLLI